MTETVYRGPGVVDARLVSAMAARVHAVHLRMDRGDSRMVVRHGKREQTVHRCATVWRDAAAEPQRPAATPPPEKVETLSVIAPNEIDALVNVLKCGDKVTMVWTLNPPHLRARKPTERVCVTVRVEHADGTVDDVEIGGATVRCARTVRRR